MADLKTIISGLYKPAKSFAEADETITTQELKEMIEKEQPGALAEDDFYNVMRSMGFKQEMTASRLEWLVKKK